MTDTKPEDRIMTTAFPEDGAVMCIARAILADRARNTPDGGEVWRPIETTDKDAPFLMLGIFRKGALREIHIGGYRYALYDDEISCWWSDQADDEICPTHWLPLPGSSSALVASPEQDEVVREPDAELVRAIRKAFQCLRESATAFPDVESELRDLISKHGGNDAD